MMNLRSQVVREASEDDLHFSNQVFWSIPEIITSYTIGFYEIPVDIRAIFLYFICIPRAFKNTKKF